MKAPYVPTSPDRPRPVLGGFDPRFEQLAALLADPAVSDVLVNGEQVWVDRGQGLELSSAWVDGGADALARRLIAAGGRHLDEVTPIADVRLGAVRVHAVLPPVAVGCALLSLRVARPRLHSLAELQRAGLLEPWQREWIDSAIDRGESVLISGATASGKTTLLRAMCAELPQTLRIVTIEDVAELQVPHPHAVSLETRQANIEGAGAIELRDLVRAALRMRPDWLVMGECRGAEVAEFLAALNTGHPGGGTIHANTLDDVPARLEAMGALAGLSETALARQAVSAFGLVVHLERHGQRRRCAGVARLRLRAGLLAIDPVVASEARTGASHRTARLAVHS